MPKTVPARPIFDLSDLPDEGLVLWDEFCSTADERRLIPFSQSTWRRRVASGDAPPAIKFFGRNASHAEHIRAVALGIDWKTVQIAAESAA